MAAIFYNALQVNTPTLTNLRLSTEFRPMEGNPAVEEYRKILQVSTVTKFYNLSSLTNLDNNILRTPVINTSFNGSTSMVAIEPEAGFNKFVLLSQKFTPAGGQGSKHGLHYANYAATAAVEDPEDPEKTIEWQVLDWASDAVTGNGLIWSAEKGTFYQIDNVGIDLQTRRDPDNPEAEQYRNNLRVNTFADFKDISEIKIEDSLIVLDSTVYGKFNGSTADFELKPGLNFEDNFIVMSQALTPVSLNGSQFIRYRAEHRATPLIWNTMYWIKDNE